MEKKQEVIVKGEDHLLEDEALRLDNFLKKAFPEVKKNQIVTLILEKNVKVNDKVILKKAQLVRFDDVVTVNPVFEFRAASKAYEFNPRPMENLNIIFEDEHLIVLNKPAGVVVHPGAATKNEVTLVEGLCHYLGISDVSTSENFLEVENILRPGIVHRLDKETTGAMVWAKTSKVQSLLAQQFQEKSNLREYVAIIRGNIKSDHLVVESYMHRDLRNRLKMSNISLDQHEAYEAENKTSLGTLRYAKSDFIHLKDISRKMSLVKVVLSTGRTHQIRSHAEWKGFPILGDTTYGAPLDTSETSLLPKALKSKLGSISRQMLHARLLGFVHPITGEKLAFKASFPDDFDDLLKVIESETQS